jgi:hypothetical protein
MHVVRGAGTDILSLEVITSSIVDLLSDGASAERHTTLELFVKLSGQSDSAILHEIYQSYR